MMERPDAALLVLPLLCRTLCFLDILPSPLRPVPSAWPLESRAGPSSCFGAAWPVADPCSLRSPPAPVDKPALTPNLPYTPPSLSWRGRIDESWTMIDEEARCRWMGR